MNAIRSSATAARQTPLCHVVRSRCHAKGIKRHRKMKASYDTCSNPWQRFHKTQTQVVTMPAYRHPPTTIKAADAPRLEIMHSVAARCGDVHATYGLAHMAVAAKATPVSRQ